MISRGLYLSLTSGALASSATLFGKLSMSSTICCHLLNHAIAMNGNQCESSFIVNTFRVLMFITMIITNVLMWTQFTKALNHYTNSLHVIVVNTSTNFFFTAFYGKVFFKESLPFLWWIGSTLILIGLIIMKTSNSDNLNKKQK